MGFFSKTKGSIISDYFKLMYDVGGLTAGNVVEVALYDDRLEVKDMMKHSASLSYSQITDVFHGLKTEITQVSKSSIGRALAGGVLFGGVGAIVGAVSGTGTKEKKERHIYFIISYTSGDGEEKFIQFEDTRAYRGAKMAAKLKELCNISTPDSVEL